MSDGDLADVFHLVEHVIFGHGSIIAILIPDCLYVLREVKMLESVLLKRVPSGVCQVQVGPVMTSAIEEVLNACKFRPFWL